MQFNRRELVAAGLLGANYGASALRARASPELDIRDFGAIGDGATDNGLALQHALAELGRVKGTLRIPPGRFLIEDRSVSAIGSPYRIPAGTALVGSGPSSALVFRRVVSPSFEGLTIDGSHIAIRDLTLEVDTGGSGWTAAIGIVGDAAHLQFTHIQFVGREVRSGHIGILPINADLENVTADQCDFRNLELGFARQTSDPSEYRNLKFVDCRASDCTEVFELNAPGLSLGATRSGSEWVSHITDDNGRPSPPRFRIGQAIRSAAFPADTRVLAIDPGGAVRMSRPAIATATPDKPARISAGRCSDGIIRNLLCSNIGQWAIGMSHCDNWEVSVKGSDTQYELVHLEDGCHDIRLTVAGVRCNKSPGVVGSPAADNGMVHVSTGCHDISIHFADADLTQNDGPLVNALCLQPGIMGTTGLRRPTNRITVSGRVLLRYNTRAVIAYETDIHFNALELRNVEPLSRASPMMRLPGCRISGTLAVFNPGEIMQAGYGATGGLERIRTLSR